MNGGMHRIQDPRLRGISISTRELAVSLEEVKDNLLRYGLLVTWHLHDRHSCRDSLD